MSVHTKGCVNVLIEGSLRVICNGLWKDVKEFHRGLSLRYTWQALWVSRNMFLIKLVKGLGVHRRRMGAEVGLIDFTP